MTTYSISNGVFVHRHVQLRRIPDTLNRALNCDPRYVDTVIGIAYEIGAGNIDKAVLIASGLEVSIEAEVEDAAEEWSA